MLAAVADRLWGDAEAVAEQPVLSFAGLLRQLRAEAKLTQEELAQAASLSPRSVSGLERGITRTTHNDTAVLLAGALGLTGPASSMAVSLWVLRVMPRSRPLTDRGDRPAVWASSSWVSLASARS